jgi:hypothetical protein
VRRLAAALIATAALVAAPSAAAIAGPLRTLVMPVTWGPEPLSNPQAQAMVDGAATFLRNASFGKLTLAADITPVLPAFAAPPECDDIRAVRDAAITAAAAAGYDPLAYSRRVYLLPWDRASCGMPSPFAYTVGRDIVIVGLFRPETLAHELGHSFGLGHAHRESCTGSCVEYEYGDPRDAMALGTGDFNPLEKSLAGWLGAPAVADRDGDFTIDQFELPSALPQALVVPTARGEYWIDHREPLGNDIGLTGPAAQGIEVRLREPALLGAALLLTPSDLVSDPRNLSDGAVVPGDAFTVRGVFSVAVLDHAGTAVGLRFHWLDTTPPGPSALKRPVSVRKGLRLAWSTPLERGSGVDRYELYLDGHRVATTGATSATVPEPVGGAHTVRVVAVDRAGNRGRATLRRFFVGSAR